MPQTVIVGVDTGGTFTDIVVYDGSKIWTHKLPSTPAHPEQAILHGLHEACAQHELTRMVHGSTVATNAVLEGKGARTVYITNAGFADLLTIGRQARKDIYALQPALPVAPVPPELCVEVAARCGADGSELQPLREAQLDALVAKVNSLAPQSVAINLLFSYLNDTAERAIAAALPKSIFVSRSAAVLAEYKEYERGIATWLNARVGPVVSQYLDRLQAGLDACTQLVVMQSAGGVMRAAQAGEHGVQLLLSGPAGGLIGARYLAAQAGAAKVLTLDMGGTSTDVALINGEIQLTTEGVVADFPVAVPMVDMHTIGAGGGSIAYLDAGGLLQVGPRSAGADPGPACYAKGGSAATVTDANVVLGRIPAAAVLGGDLRIDVDKAVSALRTLATPLGLEVAEVARGIIDIANEHMTRALRVISVERGVDPRDYVLLSFGGAGGLHVCALAQAMGMRGAIVPVHAGVLSAFGMLVAPWSRNFSRTLNGLLEEFELAVLDQYFADLYQQGRIALGADGVDEADICVQYSLDVRYRGQSTTLQVPWQGKEQTSAAFHALHQQRYGHALSMPVELVNLRVQVTAEMPAVQLPALGQAASADAPILQQARLQGIQELVNLYERECLLVGHRIVGPALIVERCATTYLAPNWQCEIDAIGNLRLCYGD